MNFSLLPTPKLRRSVDFGINTSVPATTTSSLFSASVAQTKTARTTSNTKGPSSRLQVDVNRQTPSVKATSPPILSIGSNLSRPVSSSIRGSGGLCDILKPAPEDRGWNWVRNFAGSTAGMVADNLRTAFPGKDILELDLKSKYKKKN